MSRVLLLPETSGNKPALQREAQQGGNKSSCRLFLSKSSPGTLLARSRLIPQPDAANTAAVHLRLRARRLTLQGQETGKREEIEKSDLSSLPALPPLQNITESRGPGRQITTQISASASPLCLVISLSELLWQAVGGGMGDVEKGWSRQGTETGAAKQSRQQMGGC